MELPPEGSNIIVDHHNGLDQITLPMNSKGPAQYFVMLFLLFWLGGWAVGFKSAWDQIAEGSGGFFLIFWLGGWSVGGLLVVWMLFQGLRPSKPEKLLLNKPNLGYDSGFQSGKFGRQGRSSKARIQSLIRRRKIYNFDKPEIKTLMLRDQDHPSRLTIDHGKDRIEIGKSLTEVEREWLYRQLKRAYHLNF
ncbi:hypothetical protein [Sneathiella limimaris]|uniref:hypothetical protein n=1 Tax=Sneathiella limimaris TaxID=1964213 RepID=UPI00146A7FFD|nr:hypothetical protein [Sneathiella limimaris]